MPSYVPPYRQAFRVYDPRETEPDIRLDERFQLVVAAPFCAPQVEAALGQLFYAQTGIGVDWTDIIDLAGAPRGTAYGWAGLVEGYKGHLDRVNAFVAGRRVEGDCRFLVIQMFGWEQERIGKLSFVDQLECGLKAVIETHCEFYVNMGRSGEPMVVIVGFGGGSDD